VPEIRRRHVYYPEFIDVERERLIVEVTRDVWVAGRLVAAGTRGAPGVRAGLGRGGLDYHQVLPVDGVAIPLAAVAVIEHETRTAYLDWCRAHGLHLLCLRCRENLVETRVCVPIASERDRGHGALAR
jgi:hypothetical protein